MSEGKDGDKEEKPKPVKTWPFPKDMASDFAMLEAKSEEIDRMQNEVIELIQRVEKQKGLMNKMKESTWDQVKEALVEAHPEDEKLLFSCAGLHVVTDKKLGIITHVEAYMPDGAPKALIDKDDIPQVDLRLREEGSDDKVGPASGESTTNAERIFEERYWRKAHGDEDEDEDKPEIPDMLPEDMHLDPDEE